MIFVLADPPPQSATLATPSPPVPRATDGVSLDEGPERASKDNVDEDPSVIGCDISNGTCGLLYSSFQLHTSLRKTLQVYLLQVLERGGSDEGV